MPLEKLKAIMEKKKSEAYKAMLRSQGKMEEEVEQIDENNESKIKVKSNFEDGYGPVEVHIHHPDGTKKKITSKHWYNEDPGEDNGYSRSEHNEYRAHLEKHHGLSPKESHAVAKHFDKIYKGKATDSDFTYGKHVSEEVEQVDELNKSTLASYVNKAAHQVRAKSGIASSFETQGERKRDPENKAAYANLAKDFRVGAKKRLTGIEKATAKLAKEEVELDEKKLTSAEMKKREEVAKAIERDQPGMPMGKKMAIATSTAKKVAEEKAHTVPKTSKEKDLAALAAPHDKITHADVMVGRGVSKKKTMKEFVEKLVESLDLTEAKANLHLHSYDGAEPVRHEIHGLSNTKKNSSHVFKTMTAAVAKKTGQSHADVKDAMEAHEDRHVHGMPKEEGEKVVVHKSVDDYVKHHLSTDAKNVKDSLGG
jgi:hypothetical protein